MMSVGSSRRMLQGAPADVKASTLPPRRSSATKGSDHQKYAIQRRRVLSPRAAAATYPREPCPMHSPPCNWTPPVVVVHWISPSSVWDPGNNSESVRGESGMLQQRPPLTTNCRDTIVSLGR